MAALLSLREYHVDGTPAQLGEALGTQLKEPIGEFVRQRLRAARVYLFEHGVRDDSALCAMGAACLEQLRAWDNDGWLEHQATAAAAGVDAAELYTAGNMTDIRDILLLPTPRPPAAPTSATADEGCSMVLIPAANSRSGEVIAAQTWDLNPGDLPYVVAVHRRPRSGPQTWSITCVGSPTLLGMNDQGLCIGTTNIKTRGSRPGIPYLSVLHRAIRCSDRLQAGAIFTSAPRAAAHTYWAADPTGAGDWECTSDTWVARTAVSPLVRTNHCLEPAHQMREGEAPSASSRRRLGRLQQATLGSSTKQDVASLQALFADRSDGVDSINRYGEDEQGTSTNACFITIPARRTAWACRGNSDRGLWITLDFARAAAQVPAR